MSVPAITAAASLPRGIVVTHHGGQPVRLLAKGEPTRRLTRPGTQPATFTRLSAGRIYVVEVGGQRVGALRAVDRPTAASGLTVRTTATPGTVSLAWSHRPTLATGGAQTWYAVAATSPSTAPLRRTVSGRTATLEGLDGSALYTFTVTPHNSAGAGRATQARLARPLAGPTTAATPVPTPAPTPVATPTPSPAAPSAPAPAPAPVSRTVYVCPTGSALTPAGSCRVTRAYTYTSTPYTFHDEATGPAPILDSYATTARACPGGYNLEDYGWVLYCRRYGPTPTAPVKDDAPAGYTDDGTQWTTKDPAPSGYTDDGTQWVGTVPKVPVVVTG